MFMDLGGKKMRLRFSGHVIGVAKAMTFKRESFVAIWPRLRTLFRYCKENAKKMLRPIFDRDPALSRFLTGVFAVLGCSTRIKPKF